MNLTNTSLDTLTRVRRAIDLIDGINNFTQSLLEILYILRRVDSRDIYFNRAIIF